MDHSECLILVTDGIYRKCFYAEIIAKYRNPPTCIHIWEKGKTCFLQFYQIAITLFAIVGKRAIPSYGSEGLSEWDVARTLDRTIRRCQIPVTFSPAVFFIWGTLKNLLQLRKPTTLDALRQRIENACLTISLDTLFDFAQAVGGRMNNCL